MNGISGLSVPNAFENPDAGPVHCSQAAEYEYGVHNLIEIGLPQLRQGVSRPMSASSV